MKKTVFLAAVTMILAQSINAMFNDFGLASRIYYLKKGNVGMMTKILNIVPSFVQTRLEEDNLPLHLVAAQGSTELASLLIDRGADIDGYNADHETPIFKAIYKSDSKMVKLLLDKGANLLVANSNGKTTLDIAMGQADRKQLISEDPIVKDIHESYTAQLNNYRKARRVTENLLAATLARTGKKSLAQRLPPQIYRDIFELLKLSCRADAKNNQ